MESVEIRLEMRERRLADLTGELRRFCRGRGDGLVSVFVPHATAGVAVFELGAGSEEDVLAALDRLLPPSAGYSHAHGSHGHGRDHVLPAIVSPSLTVPVLEGEPALGTWQSVVLVDLNRDNPDRRVRMSFLSA
ncbi:MAG: YjbQ family protein [Acidimicrobiia bacterium]